MYPSEVEIIKNLGARHQGHACTPSYSGGRDQEDCGSKPAWAIGLRASDVSAHFTTASPETPRIESWSSWWWHRKRLHKSEKGSQNWK
jgi:hypothetical protein